MSTGQIVGGVVGTVAGFFAGYPMLGAQLGMLAGGLIDPGKGPNTSGPRLADLTVQTSTYGAVIPRLYGTQAFTGNVFWLEGNAIKETPVKKKTGGKGGKPKSTQTTWVNTATFAVGLCKGPIDGIRRIWIKGELFYDAGSTDPSTIAASNAAAEGFEVYLGTNTQMPDPRIQADLGAANTPAWRGLAYIVFYDLNLAKYGETLLGAQVKVEVLKSGVSTWESLETVQSSASHWLSMAASPTTAICTAAIFDSNKISITHDGHAWSEVTVPTTASRYCCAWGNSIFVAMRGQLGCTVSTNDGDTWTEYDTIGATDWSVSPINGYPPYSSYNWSGICYGGGVFCAVAQVISGTTSDGVYWHKGYMPANRAWGPIAHNGSVFCTVAGGTNYAATSADGLSWTEHSMAGSGNWQGLAYGAGLFVAVAFSGGSTCQTSSDGITWTARSTPGLNYYDVTWTGSYFVAIATGSSGAFSADGITWTEFSMPYSTMWKSVVAFNGIALACTEGTTVGAYIYPRVSGAGDTLDNIVSEECLLSGIITTGDIHTSLLTSEVRGYLIASQSSIRSALEPLRASWPFDIVQHGYQLKFIPRGGSSVATIDSDDLDAHNVSGKLGVQITTSREMDSQLPRVLKVKHSDYAREYEVGEQYAERLVTDAITDETIDLPIVLTSAEAAGKAETLLYLRWLERFDISFTIPATYNNLEPADVVTLQTPEGDVSVRLVSINYTSDGRLECNGKYNSAAVYAPASVGSTPLVTGVSTLPSVGPSSYVMLDVPYMHTAQADPSFLVAMWGADGWPGGVLMRTDDSGTTWNEVQAFTSPGGTVGTASNTIGSVDSRVWDKASRLSVTLQAGDVFDATELAVLNGSNHFAYGAHGRWEIIAVQKCTLVSGSSYTFSDMLRGRFGTEWAMTTHVAGDRVVALTSSEVTTIGMSAATIGLARTYRGVTYDQDISTASDYAFTYNGVNLECLSPVMFSGYNAVGSTDWILTWVRRSRTDGEWRDLVDVGLGETTEAYEVDIFADGTYTTVKRTITATSPTCTYTTADQTTDFGSAQTTIYAKVYQMSSVVGRGYPTTASFTA